MKQQNINALRSAWILITIFYSSLLWAQPYSGGNNSGAFASNAAAINCTASRFFGGDNDGIASAATNLLNCTIARFFGDTADGAAFAKTNNFTCTPNRFFGDTADGSSAVKTSNFDCTSLRFFGDTSSGATAAATSLLECTLTRFWGNGGDGTAYGAALQARRFLGNDTAITLICSNETYNLLSLYNTTGYTFNWGTPTPATAGFANYTISALSQSGCKDTATVLIRQEIARWTGTISNNWHTAGNWDSNKVPDEKTNVIIPGGTANPCQVSTADARAATVQVRSSNSFSIINNRVLLVSGTCTALPPN